MAGNGFVLREVHWATANTTLGDVLLAAGQAGVCWLSFGSDPVVLSAYFRAAQLVQRGAFVTVLIDRVVAAIEAPSSAMQTIPLDLAGTPFQHRVWEELRAIPCGETRSYGDIAVALGSASASRAVGAANAANKVAVLVPCHRIVAADGGLGGYAWGLDIKAELLRRECEAVPRASGRLL
jgi:AraC family transcriptional regulator, regulatory protein of adaptative response / methylated-DNA-[protein]-cysteine methyltransferase